MVDMDINKLTMVKMAHCRWGMCWGYVTVIVIWLDDNLVFIELFE